MGDIEGYSDYGVYGKLKENKFNSSKAMEIGRPKKELHIFIVSHQ